MIETLWGIALPDGLERLTFAVLLIASGVTSFITAAFGIGGGGLLLAIMASLIPPAALIPVHGVVQLGSNAGRVVLFLRGVYWPALPGFAAGSVLGCIAGGLVAVELPAPVVQIGVGSFVIWSVAAKAPRWIAGLPSLTGVISSFLTMFFGATGLFVASFTKSFALPRYEHVATHAALMTVQHGLKVLVFGALGFAFAEWGIPVLLLVLAGLVGTFLGQRVLLVIPDLWFRRALDALLVLISLRLIWVGFRDLVT